MLRFVINLDSSVERWSYMRKALERFGGGTIERIPAVDGRKMSTEQMALLKDRDEFLCSRDLTPSEIGCFLSHRECWKRLIKSDQKWALIMEDDIGFSASAKDYLSSSNWIPEGINLVQLFVLKDPWKAKVSKKTYPLPDGRQLQHPFKPKAIGTQAYFISKEAALKALDMSNKLMAPVDEFLFNPLSEFADLFPVYKLNPAVVMPLDEEFTSTIDRRIIKRGETRGKAILFVRRLKKFKIHLKATLFGKVEFFTFK